MNVTEFNSWFDDFETRFPKRSEPFTSSATKTKWMQVLAETELAAAMEVNRKLHTEEITIPEFFSWERIPALVRNEADRVMVNWRLDEARERNPPPDTHTCACGGTKIVSVYRLDEVRATLTRHPPKRFSICGVACSCVDVGYRSHINVGSTSAPTIIDVRYNPQTYLIRDPCCKDDIGTILNHYADTF